MHQENFFVRASPSATGDWFFEKESLGVIVSQQRHCRLKYTIVWACLILLRRRRIRTGPLPLSGTIDDTRSPRWSAWSVLTWPFLTLRWLFISVIWKCKATQLRSFPYLAEVSFPHFIHCTLGSRESVLEQPCEMADSLWSGWSCSGTKQIRSKQPVGQSAPRRLCVCSSRNVFVSHARLAQTEAARLVSLWIAA